MLLHCRHMQRAAALRVSHSNRVANSKQQLHAVDAAGARGEVQGRAAVFRGFE